MVKIVTGECKDSHKYARMSTPLKPHYTLGITSE